MDLNAEDYQIYRVADRNKKNHKKTTKTTNVGENKPKIETHRTKLETQNRKTLPENRNTKTKRK